MPQAALATTRWRTAAGAAKVASLSLFSDREIKHLWKLFNQIDADATGSISSDEMLQLPQLKYNPLGKRVIVATFQTKEHKSADTLSFNDFVEVLSVFAPAASDQEKLKLAFKVFDFDGDRFLGRSDLEQLITALLRPATTDEDKKLHTHILDEVFREADQDQDEKLSYDEFLKAVAHSDIRSDALAHHRVPTRVEICNYSGSFRAALELQVEVGYRRPRRLSHTN